jgi:hypothetical protein
MGSPEMGDAVEVGEGVKGKVPQEMTRDEFNQYRTNYIQQQYKNHYNIHYVRCGSIFEKHHY